MSTAKINFGLALSFCFTFVACKPRLQSQGLSSDGNAAVCDPAGEWQAPEVIKDEEDAKQKLRPEDVTVIKRVTIKTATAGMRSLAWRSRSL